MLGEPRSSSGAGKGTGTEPLEPLDCSEERPVAHLRATVGDSHARGWVEA